MLKKYGLIGSAKLVVSLIYTKLFFRNARLIRLPFDIRNRRYIAFGENFVTGFGCRIEAFPISKNIEKCIQIGDNVQINDYVHIGAVHSIIIEDNVLLASKIYISDHNHGSYNEFESSTPKSIPIDRRPGYKAVRIKKNAWIGESVCVLPGVTIGEGSIIGALSVVSKDIPDFTIAVGVPAKPIKQYNFETQIWEKI
jgi:lipopolysaccharide O-acetyltransferase